jgi:hypothetical protein
MTGPEVRFEGASHDECQPLVAQGPYPSMFTDSGRNSSNGNRRGDEPQPVLTVPASKFVYGGLRYALCQRAGESGQRPDGGS